MMPSGLMCFTYSAIASRVTRCIGMESAGEGVDAKHIVAPRRLAFQGEAAVAQDHFNARRGVGEKVNSRRAMSTTRGLIS